MATQLAVLVGKIARLDCPRAWPQLLPRVLAAVRGAAVGAGAVGPAGVVRAAREVGN